MATTNPMPVSNSLTLADKCIPRLDAVYKRESLSSVLDTGSVEWTGVDTIKYYKFSTLGMADYSRGGGYVAGNSSGSWESKQLTQDRGRSYLLDAVDNEESMNMLVASQISETARTQVIPELDAYTFAKLAGTANILSGTAATIVPGTTDVPALISAAEAEMDDNEVPYEGRILFVSPTCYNALKQKIERRIINSENNVNYNVEYLDDMRIIRVPSARFNTQITLAQPTAANGAGGYSLSGNAINFMIVHPSAVIKVMKWQDVRLFTPAQVPYANGYVANFRYVHDTFVFDNKVKGIYLHAGLTVSG